MSWFTDIVVMHMHYGFPERVKNFEPETLSKLLQFRIDFLKEEMKELETAETPDDVVDALVDLCVVAIGTLAIFDVDGDEAWERVLKANMSKVVGVKPSRPNPLSLPDLIKPDGWKSPNHSDNVGTLAEVFGISVRETEPNSP